jgi:anti-anti-sigma regulatory factor
MTTLLTRAPDAATPLRRAARTSRGCADRAGEHDGAGAPPTPPSARRLVLRGGLSRADSSWLEPQLDALVATGARTVEVDLSGVTAMDGAVARLLLRTSWHLGDPARRLHLLHPPRVVHRVLRFYGAGGLVVR